MLQLFGLIRWPENMTSKTTTILFNSTDIVFVEKKHTHAHLCMCMGINTEKITIFITHIFDKLFQLSIMVNNGTDMKQILQ